MGVGAVLGGASIVGGLLGADASKDAARSQERSAEAGIAEQRAARESFEERTEPFRQIGLDAGAQLQDLLANPMAGLDEINPMVDFLRNQGFEQIQESAAAGQRLGAGGTLNDLTGFNTNLASTVVPQLQNQKFNQLFNLLGVGQNAATGQGTAALNTASNIANLQANKGAAQAQGAFGQANAITGTIQNLAGTAGAFPNMFGTPPPNQGFGGNSISQSPFNLQSGFNAAPQGQSFLNIPQTVF